MPPLAVSLIPLAIAAVSPLLKASNIRNVRTDCSIDAPFSTDNCAEELALLRIGEGGTRLLEESPPGGILVESPALLRKEGTGAEGGALEGTCEFKEPVDEPASEDVFPKLLLLSTCSFVRSRCKSASAREDLERL